MTRIKQLIFLNPETGKLTLGRPVARGECPPPGVWAYVDYNTKCFNTTTSSTTTTTTTTVAP